jgi:hypothetical protein
MWDQSGLGLQPQSPHFTMSYCLGVTKNLSKIPKAWSTRAAVMRQGHIHMHIHSIWRLSNTLYMPDIDVRSIWIGSTASITALHHELLPGSYQEFEQNPKSLVNTSSHNAARTHPYAHPQHMKVVKHFVYAWHWPEINLDWVYCLNQCISPSVIAWELPRIRAKKNLKSLADTTGSNVVRTHPYAHPQHMRVVKHLVYAWHWYRINLDWVYSLNQCILPSVISWELPRILAKS